MFLITTRNFPPELGGMQMLMGGLSKSLQNYGKVKIFAEEHKNSTLFDEKFNNNITRVSGFKFLRKTNYGVLQKPFYEFIRTNV